MTRVYLIRHGEAEGNIYRRAQGQYDGLISAKGLRQIDALAERFREIQIDALYTSDLRRTISTATAITRYHPIEMHLEPRLREIFLGPWEDKPFGNLLYQYPTMMHAFNDDPYRWHVDGAETFPELTERIRSVVKELALRHDGQTIACVSHGMAIRSLICDIEGIPSDEIWKMPHGDNTAVTLLEIDNDTSRVVFCNDASHLTPEISTFARQSWWKKPGTVDINNVHFVPLNPEKYPGTYLEYYQKTWQAVHGNLNGFQPSSYLASATRHFRTDENAIVTMLRPDNEPVGIVELDTERGKEEGYGWICLCFVEEQYRRLQLGAQLIGHAVSVFRNLGRRTVRLCVFEKNEGAIRFYEEFDFHTIGETEGVSSRLLIMEKEL